MFTPERHHEIRKLVREHRRLNFADLQRFVKVSPATLRRDLAEMESNGDIIRVHGGVLDPGYTRAELSFDERMQRSGAAKRAIGQAAAAMVPPGASVFVDAGSTCLEAGKALLGRADVRIITHSVALLTAGLRGKAEMICLGGTLRRVSGALTGFPTLGSLKVMRADWALVGASGLDPRAGCFTTELSEADIKQQILAHAGRRLLLADFTKWGQTNTIRFAPWIEFNDWVTDKIPSDAGAETLRNANVEIRLAV